MRRIAQGLALTIALGGLCAAARADDDALPEGFRKLAFARAERLSVSLGFGIGTAAQTRFNRGVDQFLMAVTDRSPSVSFDKSPKSSTVTSFEILARYYAPRHFFVESGVLFLQNGASTTFGVENSTGRLSYENMVMEVPLIVGMYWPFFDQLYLSAGLGPSLNLFNQSEWTYDLGRISSFRAARGGGFHIVGGSEWMVAEHLGLSVMLRYRHATSSNLTVVGTPYPPVQPVGELDMSGFSAVFSIRLFAM